VQVSLQPIALRKESYHALSDLFGALAAFAEASSAVEPLPRKVKPVMVWAGTDGNEAKESFDRCSSQKEWETVWYKHKGRDEEVHRLTRPEFDFDSYMVIAVFQGGSLKNYGVDVHSILEETDCIRVQYRPPLWQTGFSLDEEGVDNKQGNDEMKYDAQSFAFIVLPKSQKAIVFDQDVQDLLDAPPIWKERTKLSAMDKK
jgi:hypothetical protein